MEQLIARINRLDQRFLIVCICAIFIIIVGSQICGYNSNQTDYEPVETATVVEVLSTKTESFVEDVENTIVTFTAKVTSGELKGETVEMEQYIDPMYLPVPDPVQAGDKILALEAQGAQGDTQWSYAGINRTGAMLKLVAVFFLLILLVGGIKGGYTIISLLFSVGIIFLVYIPSILSGWNIYFTTIFTAVYIILVSLLLLNGFQTKTLCAIVGNITGTLVAGIMTLMVSGALQITGVVDQDYVFLTMLPGDISVDLKAVVWGGILIGSLGAIMDVSMSVASSMQEIAREMQGKTMPKLVYSGMQIGKDMIGTMTNTLILAYVGGSLAVVLLFAAYNKNTMVVLNLEMIVVEVMQAVVGSMGILVAVPLTVFFSAWKFMNEPLDGEAPPVAVVEKTPKPEKKKARPQMGLRPKKHTVEAQEESED